MYIYIYFIAEHVVTKEPVEAPYAKSVGSSMMVFVLCEAALILFMDINWVILRRNRKNKQGKTHKTKKEQKKKKVRQKAK